MLVWRTIEMQGRQQPGLCLILQHQNRRQALKITVHDTAILERILDNLESRSFTIAPVWWQ
jgi:hypothetical protein